jgi:hypothetical protein
MSRLEHVAIVAVCLFVTVVPSITILVLRDLVRRHFRRREKAKDERRGFEVELPPE